MRIKLIGIASVLLLLQACASTATLVSDNTFRSSDRTYTLRMAPGWAVTSLKKGKFTMVLQKGTNILLGSTIHQTGLSDDKLGQIAKSFNDSFAEQLHGHNLHQTEVRYTQIDHLRYIKTTGEASTDRKGIPLLFSSYIIAGNHHLYIMIVTGTEEQYIDEQDIIVKIPANFHEL